MGSPLRKGQNLKTAPRTAARISIYTAHSCDDSSSKGASLPHPSLSRQTMFSSLDISWNISYPCFWLQPPWAFSHSAAPFLTLGLYFLGTKSSWHHLLQVQLGVWATLSVARTPLTDILLARRGTCGVTLTRTAVLSSNLLRVHWGFFRPAQEKSPQMWHK